MGTVPIVVASKRGLTYSTIAPAVSSLERGKSLGFADGEGDGDKASDGVSRHQGKPDTLNAHHVCQQVRKRHRQIT